MEKNTLYSVFDTDNSTITENGDSGYYKHLINKYVDIFFKMPYYTEHLDEVKKLSFGSTKEDLFFAMMVRDPRFGQGFKKLGQTLLSMCNAPLADIVKCGRFDDLFDMFSEDDAKFIEVCDFVRKEIENGNALAKKWCPRFPTKNRKRFVYDPMKRDDIVDKYYRFSDGSKYRGEKKDVYTHYQLVKLALCKKIAAHWGMTKQEYGKFIKADTTESNLSQHTEDAIKFEQVPSLASLKYEHAFKTSAATKARYAQFIEDVKSGKVALKTTLLKPYDIIKKAATDDFEADLFFGEMFKAMQFVTNCICTIDTSGSMSSEDAIRKALAIGHFLSLCSTYHNGQCITFSDYPQLIDFVNDEMYRIVNDYWGERSEWTTDQTNLVSNATEYGKQINRMCQGGWMSNTDLSKVMSALQNLDADALPQYIVVLSDMEFDRGSKTSIDTLMRKFKAEGITTRIVWWNFNSRNATCPQMDDEGNIFLSGYEPRNLAMLSSDFDAASYIKKLLEEYKKNIGVL